MQRLGLYLKVENEHQEMEESLRQAADRARLWLCVCAVGWVCVCVWVRAVTFFLVFFFREQQQQTR